MWILLKIGYWIQFIDEDAMTKTKKKVKTRDRTDSTYYWDSADGNVDDLPLRRGETYKAHSIKGKRAIREE